MLKETVEVIDKTNDKVKVKFHRKPMCDCCKFGLFCGKSENTMIIDSQGFSLEKADMIEVGIEEKKSLLLSVIIFLIPVLIFIFTLWFLKNKGEVTAFTIAIFAVLAYYGIFKIALRNKKDYFKLTILKKI